MGFDGWIHRAAQGKLPGGWSRIDTCKSADAEAGEEHANSMFFERVMVFGASRMSVRAGRVDEREDESH